MQIWSQGERNCYSKKVTTDYQNKMSDNIHPMMILPPKKPWTVAQFELYRSHMSNWVTSVLVPLLEDPYCRRVVARGPVKSGKREMVEYMAKRDESHTSPRVHAFLSAWHRAADKEQREELTNHNVKVFSFNKKAVADECLKWVRDKIALGKTVVLHLDECDHGSGEAQNLGQVYKLVRDMSQVFTILYSATPEEVLFSKEVADKDEAQLLEDMDYGTKVVYTPPPGYCGPARFLDENLVIEATAFFTMTPVPALTEQGRDIIAQLRVSTASGSGRNIVTLRLTNSKGKGKEGKEIYQFLKHYNQIPELNGIDIMVDKSGPTPFREATKIDWSREKYWNLLSRALPIVIVQDQTATRSTEWACHDRIFATHDYRNTRQYATMSQAQERANHYEGKYGGFQPIKIYGHKKTFELSAGRISYEQYFDCPWSMRKVDARRADKDKLGEVYDIRDKNGRPHPNHKKPLPKAQAEEVLKGLGCFYDVSLSSRVRGSVSSRALFKTCWFPCTSTTWAAAIEREKGDKLSAIRQHTFKNPFQNTSRLADMRLRPDPDGREKGYLRGWRVLDYEEDVVNSGGGGSVTIDAPRPTICYSKGILGVAIRWHTGEYCEENKLSTQNSMYLPKD